MYISRLVLHVAQCVRRLFECTFVADGIPYAGFGVLFEETSLLASDDLYNVPADERSGSVGRYDVLIQVKFHVMPVGLVAGVASSTRSKIVYPFENVTSGSL